MDTAPRQDIVEEAARAAREAADEAATPEARFFLRQHANLLARIAATRDRAKNEVQRTSRPAAWVLPLIGVLPGV